MRAFKTIPILTMFTSIILFRYFRHSDFFNNLGIDINIVIIKGYRLKLLFFKMLILKILILSQWKIQFSYKSVKLQFLIQA